MPRPLRPSDTDAVLALVAGSGMFDAESAGEVAATLAGHLGDPESPAIWLVVGDSDPVGVLFAAPEPMTDGTWNALMLIVHPDHHGRGHAQALLGGLEGRLREQGARLLLVETSSLPEFERARAFYPRYGFREESRVREYYQAGEDKIIYAKSL